jgi:hypothetical protein
MFFQHQNVVNGVVSIDVDIEIPRSNINSVIPDLNWAVGARTGRSIESYDHILYYLPYGSQLDGETDWTA